MKKLLVLIAFFAVMITHGQELASFSSVQNTGCSGVVSNDTNVTATGICRGPGISPGGSVVYDASGWTTSNFIDTNDYFEWTIAPNAGYQIDLTSLDISYLRDGINFFGLFIIPIGPSTLDLQIDTGSGFSSVFIDTSVTAFPFFESNNIDLSSFTGLTSTITFRLYGYNAATFIGAAGNLYIYENTATNKGVIINGTVSPISGCSGSTTTWNGSAWDNGNPDLTTPAILNDDYNTSTDGGSIIACSLTVSNSSTLIVANNTHLTIQGDVTVDSGSSIEVQSYGAVVQNDDSALVTNNGAIQVTKTTAPLNAWYEYTYWSSPVSGETIGGGLFESEDSRRFVFNAQNYLDATAETGNNNATDPGQDGIDDNGDDWQWVSGATVMTPGVGYAATHSQLGFVISGVGYDYIFEGAFNNGVITVPIYRNDSELADENPNLIGNPYPSAISADLFISANPSLDGVINLWSQNTAPSSTVNGNEDQNFSTSDYAKINGASQTAGGDGVMPNRFIPSGQAFFVSMDNAAAPVTLVSGMIYTTDVIFNNSMRVSGTTNNSQFFKNSNKTKKSSQIDNKLWVNLTSDNGLFHQISVAYVNGATNLDDGAYYDAERVITPNTFSGLYSTIDDKKFAIQGREPGSLDENEVIKLGFKTSIEIATLYKLSIADIQGDFLTNNTVYLKDNFLNKTHNLSESDYTFTSEVGEFNERFEIVFNNIALSTTEQLIGSNSLKIVDLGNDEVQFSVTENLEIQSVIIYDLLGRSLKSFKGNSNKELFNLSELSSSVFIAEVTLSNGLVLSKKAVKK